MVYYHREWAIPEDYKQWLGQSLPCLVPCRYFARGDCQYGDACKFLHEVKETAVMGSAKGSSAELRAEQNRDQRRGQIKKGKMCNVKGKALVYQEEC